MLSGASQTDALQWALEFGINLRCKDRTWKLPLALNKSPLSTAKNIVRQLFVLPTSWVLILNHLVLRLQMSWRLLLRSLPVRNGKKYKRARTNAALYRAAALLWGKGVDMATAISIVESAMRDAGEVWFLPWDSSWISPKKQNKLTLKLVDILSFVDTPGPFPTQMWYLRARCNTTQTYQIWKCHGVIVFHSDSFDGHLAKQKICAEHSAEIRPFVKQCSPAPCGSDWGPDWNKCRSSTQALHFHMPNSTFS